MLTSLLSALEKKNLYVMINPLLKGRKLSAKKRVLLDFSASEM